MLYVNLGQVFGHDVQLENFRLSRCFLILSFILAKLLLNLVTVQNFTLCSFKNKKQKKKDISVLSVILQLHHSSLWCISHMLD